MKQSIWAKESIWYVCLSRDRWGRGASVQSSGERLAPCSAPPAHRSVDPGTREYGCTAAEVQSSLTHKVGLRGWGEQTAGWGAGQLWLQDDGWRVLAGRSRHNPPQPPGKMEYCAFSGLACPGYSSAKYGESPRRSLAARLPRFPPALWLLCQISTMASCWHLPCWQLPRYTHLHRPLRHHSLSIRTCAQSQAAACSCCISYQAGLQMLGQS